MQNCSFSLYFCPLFESTQNLFIRQCFNVCIIKPLLFFFFEKDEPLKLVGPGIMRSCLLIIRDFPRLQNVSRLRQQFWHTKEVHMDKVTPRTYCYHHHAPMTLLGKQSRYPARHVLCFKNYLTFSSSLRLYNIKIYVYTICMSGHMHTLNYVCRTDESQMRQKINFTNKRKNLKNT